MSTRVEDLVKIGTLAAETGATNATLLVIAREHGLTIHYIGTARLLSRRDADFVADRYVRIHRPVQSAGHKNRPAAALA